MTITSIEVPNRDLLDPEFTALAQGTVAQTSYFDYNNEVLVGRFVRSRIGPDPDTALITVSRRRPYRALMQGPILYGEIVDCGVLPLKGRPQPVTIFHMPADHPLALRYSQGKE